MNEELLVSAATEDTVVVRAHCKVHDGTLTLHVFGINFNWFWSPFIVKGIARRPEKHPTISAARNKPRPIVRELDDIH